MTLDHSRQCITGEGTKLSLHTNLTLCVCVCVHACARVCSVVPTPDLICVIPQMWPAKLLCPWDFPGKNTGVGCHFLL